MKVKLINLMLKSVLSRVSQLDEAELFLSVFFDFFYIVKNKVLEAVLDEDFIFTGESSELIRQFKESLGTLKVNFKDNRNLVIFQRHISKLECATKLFASTREPLKVDFGARFIDVDFMILKFDASVEDS